MVASYDLRPQLGFLKGIPRIPSVDDLVSVSKNWEVKTRRAMIDAHLKEPERLGDKLLSGKEKVKYKVADSIVRTWEIEKALLEAKYESSITGP